MNLINDAKERNIKVLHVITRLIRGGAEINTLLTIQGLEKLGYEVSLAAGPSDKTEGNLEDDVRQSTRNLMLLHNLVREVSPLNDLIAFLKLYLFIKKGKFQIVHTHVRKAGIIGRWAAKLAGVPIIIHTTHGNFFHGYFNRLITKFFVIIERITALITDRIITLTKIEQSQYMERGIGKLSQYKSIPSGIDLKRFDYNNIYPLRNEVRRSLGLCDDDFIIGNIGRIAPIKGHEYLIRSATEVISKIPNAKFMIVGDGPIRSKMEELASQLKISDKVIFTGIRMDIPECLSVMDLFVLPSLNEGMGRALVEAMAMRVPVIASNIGGIPEVIVDGETGLLVPSKNSEVLAKAIIRLSKDKKLAEKLSQAGYEKAHLDFGIETMVNNISSVYQEMIKFKIMS